MGMSSSQARLLNLTARMHQIEYKAAKLEAMKLQMANESSRVYDDYLNAIDATKIQYSTISTDGTINYVDATYNGMKNQGYELKFADSDKVIIDAATEANLKIAGNNKDYFIALETGRVTETNQKVNGVVEIYTIEQFMNMSSNKNYRLMADIDLTGKNWTSKSLSSGKTFDGNGHTIKGLNNALFTSVSGTVTNLNIEGNVTSKGILTENAYSGANINNVSVSGSINAAKDNVGALVGNISGSSGNKVKISNCSSNATIITSSNNSNIGGLVGASSNAEIDNCTSNGSISGNNGLGGLIGATSNTTITNSTSSTYVRAEGTAKWGHSAGGFVGITYDYSNVSNCSAYGNVDGDDDVVGGFVGCANPNSKISNCNAYGNVTDNFSGILTKDDGINNVAGFVSAVNGGTVENCNAYGTASIKVIPTGYNSTINPGAFGNSNMSGHNGIGQVKNCYAADKNNNFMSSTTSLANNSGFESALPNNNIISASGANVSTTTSIPDTNNDGALFDEIQKNGYVLEGTNDNPATGHEDDSTWFTNMVNAGELFIFDTNKTTGELEQISVATDTKLREVSNESLLRKAEAKYEADMKKIDNKDRKYDTDLAALDTERNAIKEEMDTLKTVAKENVERTFKLFG